MSDAAAPNASPNSGEIDNWNNVVGKSWALLHERLDRQIAPIGHAAMQKAVFRQGERVLDVGCGCGETTLEIAGRVGPMGEVEGVDISALLLGIAREAARSKGLDAIRFVQADAQTHGFPARAFDVVFSRFGVMFFEDPAAAFANIRKAIRPRGRLAFCCWRTPKENLWLSLPMQTVGHLLPPMPPADPNAPGPFAFADDARVRGILEGAGFTEVGIEPLDTVTGAESVEDSVFLAMRIGQLGAALRQAQASDELKQQVQAALTEAFKAHANAQGVVQMPAAAWIVTARNP